jgi:hypothetical protein
MSKEAPIEAMLGHTYRDRITGFQGICTGRAEYLSGCAQALIVPSVKADGSYARGEWFDEQRLELLDSVAAVTLNNERTPGPDREAPKR